MTSSAYFVVGREYSEVISLFAAVDLDDVLEVPTLWQKLKPIPSPFVKTNYYGGGFVDEDDRIAISSIHFASEESTGAKDRCRPQTRIDMSYEDVRSLLNVHMMCLL
jgi:hypothetical protein